MSERSERIIITASATHRDNAPTDVNHAQNLEVAR